MIKVAQALAEAQGVERLDAQLLLLHAWGKTERAWLMAHDDEAVPPDVATRYAQLCERRAQGEPLAYLVGCKEFFGLNLQVDARVLVPRPDTETLVEWALQALKPFDAPHVLDLGTGSGAIALAIQHARPDARVCAVDASTDALAVAAANARQLGLGVTFMQSNWLEKVSARFHVIVSNPPYIAEHDPHLVALMHEPLSALAAGPDGLQDIEHIIEQAPAHLHPGGWLLLEHGFDQGERVQALLQKRGFSQVQSRQDLCGQTRCSGGIMRPSSPPPVTP